MWINWKRKGKRDLQALEDKNPWRFEAENNKNFRLDRKLALTDRKTNSIDLAPIEPGRFKPKILSHFRSDEME